MSLRVCLFSHSTSSLCLMSFLSFFSFLFFFYSVSAKIAKEKVVFEEKKVKTTEKEFTKTTDWIRKKFHANKK